VPEIRYQFVSTGGREVVDTFRSIEGAAKASAAAMREVDRAGRLRAPRRPRGGGGDLGASAGAGGPYRTPGGGGGEAPMVRFARASAERLMSVEQRAAEKRGMIARREWDQRLGIVRTSTRAIEREIQREDAARQRTTRRRLSAIGGAVASVGTSILGGATSLIGSGIDMAGGLVRSSLSTQAIANRVSINARAAGAGGVDPTTLRKEFEATAIANPGQQAADIGKATQAYVDLTGDLNTARSSMETFATVASATGASVVDVATAAASLGSKFDVKKTEDMRAVLAGLAFQGKGGAMTLKDLAAQFQRLASAGAAFGLGKGPEAVAKLGGILQIARQGTGGPRAAATAVENIFSGLVQKGGKIAGLKVYDKKGGKRDINEVLADAVTLAGGNNMQRKEQSLLKVFGKQGIRGVNPLLAAYKDAAEGKTGKDAQEAGHAAVLKMLQDMASTGAQWAEIQKDAAQAQEDTSARLTGAWEQLTAAAGESLAPAIADLATKFATNRGALDLFAAALAGAGASLEAFADFAQKRGWIDGGTPEEKKAAALKKVGTYEAQMQGLDPNSKQYAEVYSKRNRAIEEVAAAKRAGAVAPLSPTVMSMYSDLFAQRYAAAAPDKNQTIQEAKGRTIAKRLASDSNDWWATSDTANFRETDAQRAERHKFQHLEGPYAPQGGVDAGDTSTKGIIAEAMAALRGAAAEQKAASTELKAAAVSLNKRPTIAGGTK
jgi:hypothetical protein